MLKRVLKFGMTHEDDEIKSGPRTNIRWKGTAEIPAGTL